MPISKREQNKIVKESIDLLESNRRKFVPKTYTTLISYIRTSNIQSLVKILSQLKIINVLNHFSSY